MLNKRCIDGRLWSLPPPRNSSGPTEEECGFQLEVFLFMVLTLKVDGNSANLQILVSFRLGHQTTPTKGCKMKVWGKYGEFVKNADT